VIDMLRIFVECIATHNNGGVHGAWIDLGDKTEDEVDSEIKAMLAKSPHVGAEEWFVTDYEGFNKLKASQYDLKDLCRLSHMVEEYGEWIIELVKDVGDIDNADRYMRDNYIGEYESPEYFAECQLDENYPNFPENLRDFFDFHAFALALESDGYLFVVAGPNEIHVFNY
jgi:antirestriction protein